MSFLPLQAETFSDGFLVVRCTLDLVDTYSFTFLRLRHDILMDAETNELCVSLEDVLPILLYYTTMCINSSLSACLACNNFSISITESFVIIHIHMES